MPSRSELREFSRTNRGLMINKHPATSRADQILTMILRKLGEDDNDFTSDTLRKWMPNILKPAEIAALTDYHHVTDSPPSDWDKLAWYYLRKCVVQHTEDVPFKYERIHLNDMTSKPLIITEKNNEKIKQEPCPPDLGNAFIDVQIHALTSYRDTPGKASPIVHETIEKAFATLKEHGFDTHGIKHPNPNDCEVRFRATSAMTSIFAGNQAGRDAPKIPGFDEAIEWIHNLWQEVDNRHTDISEHPLMPIVGAWINHQKRRSISTGSISHVNGISPISYLYSQFNRMQFENAAINTISVDGQPFAARIAKNVAIERKQRAKLFVQKNTKKETHLSSQQLEFQTPRKPLDLIYPIIGFTLVDYNPAGTLASDMANFLYLINMTNHDLILTVSEMAQILARDEKGYPRPPEKSDEQRAINAWRALHGILIEMKTERGLIEPYNLVKSDRTMDRYILGAPKWLQDLKPKQHTLSAGFSSVGRSRLVGKISDGGIWRFICAAEYFLARKTKKVGDGFISDLLIPAEDKKTGPGKWERLHWTMFRNIGGDRWDDASSRETQNAKKRHHRFIENAKAAGYEVPRDSLNAHASAEDTIEFYFGIRGTVLFRASQRFTEAERKRVKSDWDTTSIKNYFGLP